MKDKIGQTVVLDGIARDAKSGAVVLIDDSPVYLEGLDAWPSGMNGVAVRVTGTLREKKKIGDPVNEKGELTQGAWGTQLVVESAKWEKR